MINLYSSGEDKSNSTWRFGSGPRRYPARIFVRIADNFAEDHGAVSGDRYPASDQSIGLFEFQRLETGIPGTLAVLLQVLGALILIGRDLAILSDAFYPIGALTFAVGLDLFAITSWKAKTLPRWVLLLLILSTVIGPIGFFSPSLSILFAASGIVFGIGFASAGTAICLPCRHR